MGKADRPVFLNPRMSQGLSPDNTLSLLPHNIYWGGKIPCADQLVGGTRLSMTWSMVKLAAFWRGGYSLNVFRKLPT